jgi:uncharacterized membrane protein YfbV (UPF0208 family)
VQLKRNKRSKSKWSKASLVKFGIRFDVISNWFKVVRMKVVEIGTQLTYTLPTIKELSNILHIMFRLLKRMKI